MNTGMNTVLPGATSAPDSCEALEAAIVVIETRLDSMGAALQQRDAAQLERCASDLHRALTDAVQMSTLAARRQGLPPALRQRLARASGQVAAQREVLARATAALDRAIDVLIPRSAAPVVYGRPGAGYGLPKRGASGG